MKSLKKIIALMLTVALVLTLVSCGDSSGSQSGGSSGSGGGGTEKLNLTIVGGSIGGAWAAIGEGVAEIIRRDYPGSVVSYEVGSEAANMALVSTGDVDLGIGHTGLMKLAMEGSEPFPGKLDNLRTLCVLYGEAANQFFVKASTGITSFGDLVSKQYPLNVNFNTKDSFMELVATAILEYYGASVDDIKSWGGNVDYMSMTSSIDLMRDGKLDAYSNLIQVPSSSVVDAATTMDLVMLPLSDECCDAINAEFGTYTTTMPAGGYTFMTEDVQTVAAKVVLYASADMSDETAYAIVEAISHNFEYFQSIHSSLAEVTLAELSETDPIPLHPGAEKFFSEQA